jgi:hypothetical protein
VTVLEAEALLFIGDEKGLRPSKTLVGRADEVDHTLVIYLIVNAGTVLALGVEDVEEAEIPVIHTHHMGAHDVLAAIAVKNASFYPGLAFVIGSDTADIGLTQVIATVVVFRPGVKNRIVLQADKATLGIAVIGGCNGQKANLPAGKL